MARICALALFAHSARGSGVAEINTTQPRWRAVSARAPPRVRLLSPREQGCLLSSITRAGRAPSALALLAPVNCLAHICATTSFGPNPLAWFLHHLMRHGSSSAGGGGGGGGGSGGGGGGSGGGRGRERSTGRLTTGSSTAVRSTSARASASSFSIETPAGSLPARRCTTRFAYASLRRGRP